MDFGDLCNVWFVLGFMSLRILFAILPLNGYIHPDEFFQSSEIMAGDLLGFNVTNTWEWNKSMPLRSPVFPYISSGLPFWVLFETAELVQLRITSDMLVISPRVFMALLSFIIDYIIWKTASIYVLYSRKKLDQTESKLDEINYAAASVVIFGSSHVTLNFLPRTFSNSIETILYAVLLYLIIKESVIIRRTDVLKNLLMGALMAFGFFVRPTFLLFAIYPMSHYIVKSISNVSTFLKLAIPGIVGSILVSSIIILVDSKYFSTDGHFGFAFTPLNFIKYNIDPESLKQHGEHVRFLHFLVSLPILFGPLYLVVIIALIFKVLCYIKYEDQAIFSNNVSKFLTLSFFTSVLLMSVFKHQEPRYILPAIFPLSLLVTNILIEHRSLMHVFGWTWIGFNILLLCVFGLLHQGGVVPCISYLHQKVHSLPKTTLGWSFCLIFWQTYMVPQHLLAIPKVNNSSNIRVKLYDFAGASTNEVENLINAKLHEPDSKEDRVVSIL